MILNFINLKFSKGHEDNHKNQRTLNQFILMLYNTKGDRTHER